MTQSLISLVIARFHFPFSSDHTYVFLASFHKLIIRKKKEKYKIFLLQEVRSNIIRLFSFLLVHSLSLSLSLSRM